MTELIYLDNRAIGVFDSGLGGLTAVRELRRALPQESLVYFGDTGRVPYGTRSAETIFKYAKQDIRFLLSFNVKCIVVACGTVSSAALPRLGDIGLPVIGVIEPAVEAAKAATKNGRIGVVGTPATIRSGAYERGLSDYEVASNACPLLVPLVEDGRNTHRITEMLVDEYLTPLLEKGIDTLIMGCTHYPLIAPLIAARCGDGVTLIDPGAETVRRLQSLISPCDGQGRERYYVSDSTEQFARLAGAFLGGPAPADVTQIPIEEY
jgi:glutamate racemase